MNEGYVLNAAERQAVMALVKSRQDFLQQAEAVLAEMDAAMRDIVGLYAQRAGLPSNVEVMQEGDQLRLIVPVVVEELEAMEEEE